jgi:hypothetical protein
MSGRRGLSPRESDRLLLRATSTHLYRGSRLRPAEPVTGLGDAPRGIRIVFSDGVEVDAELLRSDRGELALDVPSYTTAAGTGLDQKTWRATAVEDAEGAVLAIGERMPGR